MRQIFSIVAWRRCHESYESRKLKKALEWISVPTTHSTCGYRRLMREPDGTALYGAYIQIATLAASCTPRGFLIHPDGQPHDAESIALRVGGDVKIISRCLEVLQRSDINWLSSHPFTPAEIPADSSRLQQTPADSSRFQQTRWNSSKTRARVPSPPFPFCLLRGSMRGNLGEMGCFRSAGKRILNSRPSRLTIWRPGAVSSRKTLRMLGVSAGNFSTSNRKVSGLRRSLNALRNFAPIRGLPQNRLSFFKANGSETLSLRQKES